jgi:hypothetical protein
VRLRHPPTELIVIAEESRSQHENRAKALRRLREALYLKLRDSLTAEELAAAAVQTRPELTAVRDGAGRLDVGRKDPRYWPLIGLVLDVLNSSEARVSETAELLGISTGQLIDLLQTNPRVWEQANLLRTRFRHKPLKDT